jgi:hypothetical protein
MNIRQLGIEAQRQVVSEMAEKGSVPVMEFAPDAVISEMLGTDSGPREFIEQVTYSAYAGRETVPLLYGAIYRTVSDPNLPKSLTEEQFGPLQAVFLQFWEGGEVKFGALGEGSEKTVKINTWTTGMEYNEDIVEFNETWRVTEIATAFGEAYNKLLNHLHLGPLVTATFTTTGGGIAAQKTAQDAGTAQEIVFDTDIATTLSNALKVLPAGSLLLHNTADEQAIDEAVAGSMHLDGSPTIVKRKFGSMQRLAYDGDTVTVRKKTYTYPGVTAGEAILLVPKQQFVEYEKHGLRVDSNNGDLTRLVLAQVVGRTRRGVFAAIGGKFGAIKINLS